MTAADAHRLWAMFHGRPFHLRDPGYERRWLRWFADQIPCPQCRADFLALIESNPPDLSGRVEYARWGWGIHDAINVKVDNYRLPWVAACDLYGWLTPFPRANAAPTPVPASAACRSCR